MLKKTKMQMGFKGQKNKVQTFWKTKRYKRIWHRRKATLLDDKTEIQKPIFGSEKKRQEDKICFR